MKLSEQCCTLEQSQELERLGVTAKPADKRTPIEQAIFAFDEKVIYFDSLSAENPQNKIVAYSFQVALEHLMLLLPAEREHIEAAYTHGEIDSCTESINGQYNRDYKDKTDYFTQTYGTP